MYTNRFCLKNRDVSKQNQIRFRFESTFNFRFDAFSSQFLLKELQYRPAAYFQLRRLPETLRLLTYLLTYLLDEKSNRWALRQSGGKRSRVLEASILGKPSPLLRRTRRFFPSGDRNHRRYSLHRPTEGRPGWVGLSSRSWAGATQRGYVPSKEGACSPVHPIIHTHA